MADAESDDDFNNEWSVLALSYEDVLLPRFQVLYDTIAYYVAKEIQSKNKNDKYRLLDYGTGPGEPILTILQRLSRDQLHNVELEANDSSRQMVSLAKERLQKLKNEQLTVHFSTVDDSSNKNTYDILTVSLVLPYASSQNEMVRTFSHHLKPDGLLISSHWPHPEKVPFLSILKRVVHFMATGKRINVADLESDPSFSCWQEEKTTNVFMSENFIIDQWIKIQLSMSFPNIRTLLSFCRMAKWFEDSLLYLQAEQETMRILCEDLHLKVQSTEPFVLPSEVVVVVAYKRPCSKD